MSQADSRRNFVAMLTPGPAGNEKLYIGITLQ